MSDAFTAGFRISVIGEPLPAAAARELLPAEREVKPRVCFLFVLLEAV